MLFTLVVEKGEPAGTVIVLKQGENIIGRSSGAVAHLASPDISGTHARITVKEGAALLENLSRFGTRLDDAEVTAPTPLRHGQRIAVGKATVLLVQANETAAPVAADAPQATRANATLAATRPLTPPPIPALPHEAATGEGIPGPDDRTRAAHSAGADGEPLSRPDWTSAPGGDGETRAMQTRAASPEEIELLRVTEQKKVRKHVMLGFAIGIPLLIALYLAWPNTPPPETEFGWPRDVTGKYLDAFEPAPSGSAKEGGYDICYPGTPDAAKQAIPGGLAFKCSIGRDLNVPVRITLLEELDKKFATLSRMEMVEDWIQQLSSSGGSWNFDRPSPNLLFLGKERGLPTIRVTYQRDGKDGSWFGVATVFRHGVRRISLRAEAPASERVRAERLLSAQFLRPSLDFGRTCWEPVRKQPSLSDEEILREVRQELDRLAPSTWSGDETLLAALLTRAALAEKQDLETEALGLLAKLREREALWFNSQQLAVDAATMQGSTKKAGKIAELCKGVFSDTEDQRYYTVRKWRTEP